MAQLMRVLLFIPFLFLSPAVANACPACVDSGLFYFYPLCELLVCVVNFLGAGQNYLQHNGDEEECFVAKAVGSILAVSFRIIVHFTYTRGAVFVIYFCCSAFLGNFLYSLFYPSLETAPR
jgi:hypothetical protein